jgi:hypothetical protein
MQSGHDRVRQAEGLILQLPKNHDGRNSWLLNYGDGSDAFNIRGRWQAKTGTPVVWDEETQSMSVVSTVQDAPKEKSGPAHNVSFKAYVGTKHVSAMLIAVIDLGAGVIGPALFGHTPGELIGVTREWIARHSPEEGGYVVLYEDGYMSYSPPNAFKKAYRLIADGLNIGDVHMGLNEGRKFARAGWNGKGMYIMKQVPDEHSKMTEGYTYMVCPPGSTTQYKDQTSEHLVPWLCSQGDFYATDWLEVTA